MPALALTELERRVIGNLGQPRNVAELAWALRADPAAEFDGNSSEEELDRFLRDVLAKEGWVVNLGEAENASKAASLHKKGALRMPDEQARIFERRLSAPHRAWRLRGDLWRLTEEGLAALQEPPPGVSTAMVSREQVERMIREHFDAVIGDVTVRGSITDEEGGTLVGDPTKIALCRAEIGQTATLLPEEFVLWRDSIIEAYNEAHPDEPPIKPSIAGGAGYGDATEDLIQAADAGGTAYGETAPTFFALTTVAVTDTMTGSTITEAGYTGYARKSTSAADLGTSSAGTRTNANAIVWAGATGGSATVIGAARCTASSAGRVIRYLSVASTVVSATQTPAQFAAGALTDTLD